jgi:hypothetical protein
MSKYTNKDKILIFDLDRTIDSQCMRYKPREIVKKLLEACRQHNWHVYVITARRLEDFDYEPLELFSYNVPSDLVTEIMHLNRDKHHRWLYYSRDMDEPEDKVRRYIFGFPHIRDSYHEDLVKDRSDDPNYKLGLLKMMQIEEIISHHALMNENFDYRNVYFFDDSRINKECYDWYTNNMNKYLRFINFIGGNNKSVFGNLNSEESAKLAQLVGGVNVPQRDTPLTTRYAHPMGGQRGKQLAFDLYTGY